jgi:hypothetical protein
MKNRPTVDMNASRDLAEAVTAALEQPRVLDLVGGMGDRPADLAARGFGHSAGVGGAFGGEGACRHSGR